MARKSKSKILDVKIEKVEFPTRARGYYEDREIRFKGGIEGQVVRVKTTRNRKDYKEAKLLEVLEKSDIEVEKKCSHYGECGGCAYQTLEYEDEIKLKKKQILSLFQKGEIYGYDFLGVEKSPSISAYRNKMEYTFGDEYKDGPLALGLHKKGRFYEVVNVDDCNIIDQDFTNIRKIVLEYFKETKKAYYNKRNHEGFLRHLVVRKSISKNKLMVNLVTTSQDELNEGEFVDKLLAYRDDLNILHTINDGLGDTVKADEMKILRGEDKLVEEVLDLQFEISPFSFFQTNTRGAESLYSIARDFIGDIDDKVIFDLYSGTGTIAQIMAKVAKKVVGIEIVEEAVEKARENAKLNKLENVEFIAADVLAAIEDLKDRPDLIVIDPPRDGIHPKAIDKIIDFNPDKFVYISCNPITLVRDLKVFEDRGYRVDKVKCMDMFARTPHVECVVLITRV